MTRLDAINAGGALGRTKRPAIARANELKEELLDLCESWHRQTWLDWKEKAARLPGDGDEAATGIDLAM